MTNWKQIQEVLRGSTSPAEYRNWLEPVRMGPGGNEHELCLVAPNDDVRAWVETEYRQEIARAARSVGMPVSNVKIMTVRSARSLRPEPKSQPVQQVLDFGDAAQEFNQRYTFQRFVVGSCNEFAHAAARAVSTSPAESYNPLFLYSGTGLGKTHLLHAIGQDIQYEKSDMRIVYVTAEDFMNDMIKSIRNNKMNEFRFQFRTADALLVDDIQMIGSKERTQEEFFHTFNALHNRGKQIVLTSDSNPALIPGLVERLKSRFAWGLMADIQPPALETKMAILHRNSEERGTRIPNDIATYIASRLNSSIRELEEFVNQITARAQFLGGRVTLDMVKHIFEASPPRTRAKGRSCTDVLEVVAREFGVSVDDLSTRNNSPQAARPRQIAMYLCRKLTEASLTEIGKTFRRHHSTVLHSVRKIEKEMVKDRELDACIIGLIQHINGSSNYGDS